MEPEEKELLQKAQQNPAWMFDEKELATLCNVSQVIVGRAVSAQDSPFFLGKCRPEWLVEWMRRHTEFGAGGRTLPRGLPKGTPQASNGANPWAEARRAGAGQREK